MRVGDATLRAVIEIDDLRTPPQFFVSDVSLADFTAQAQVLSPQFIDLESFECRVSQHAWLIEENSKRILVDPCVGHQRHRPALPFYHMIDSPLLDRLAALGAPPETIDYVFCTHLHLDHVGWNTRLVDGRFMPTFPNARYLFSRAEEAYWRRDMNCEVSSDPTNAGVFAECIEPVLAAGLADLVEPGVRIADCLTLIDAAGHTIGHLAGVLESAGEGVVLAGDAIHHPIQVLLPDRPMHAYDEAQAKATRRMLLDLCADKDWWLAPAHFRAPHLCKIRRHGGRYGMEWAAD